MAQAKQVSEKNTKREIFSAYQELLAKLGEGHITASIQSQLEKTNTLLVDSLRQDVRGLTHSLQTATEEVISKLTETLKLVSSLGEAYQRQQKMLSRQKEEDSYELALGKKRQEEELRETRRQVEKELDQKRAELEAEHEELLELRKTSKTLESRLDQAAKEARDETTKELTLRFDHEKALAAGEIKLTRGLLEQKIALLEQSIVSQQAEIARLNAIASAASEQVTRIAEHAVGTISQEAHQT